MVECLSPTHHFPTTLTTTSTILPFHSIPSSPIQFAMDRHRCKLCSRCFVNGRALGGHMKAHLASLSRPTSPHIPPTTLSSTSPDADFDVEDVKSLTAIYRLRENPKKSIKFSDPEFSFSASGAGNLVVVQDGESEAESRDQGRRRKRSHPRRSSSPEAEPVSSVSDTSPEEDVAMCLMMLSRDDGWKNVHGDGDGTDSIAQKKQQHQCEICKKCFRSSQALGGHRIIHRKKVVAKEKKIIANDKHKSFGYDYDDNSGYIDKRRRMFECPFCGKVFGSGQALGGHKRSHLMGGFGRSSSSAADVNNNDDNGVGDGCFIDLNMPALAEDEDVYSVVSDTTG